MFGGEPGTLCAHVLAKSAPSGSCLADPPPQPTAHVGASSTQDAPAGLSVTAPLQPGQSGHLSPPLSQALPEAEAGCDLSGAQPDARPHLTRFTPTRADDQPSLTVPSNTRLLPLSEAMEGWVGASLQSFPGHGGLCQQHFLPLLKSCSYLHLLLPTGLVSTALI